MNQSYYTCNSDIMKAIRAANISLLRALNPLRGDSRRVQGFAALNTGGRPFVMYYESAEEYQYQELLLPLTESNFNADGLSFEQKLEISKKIKSFGKAVPIIFVLWIVITSLLQFKVYEFYNINNFDPNDGGIVGWLFLLVYLVVTFGPLFALDKLETAIKGYIVNGMIKDFRFENMQNKLHNVEERLSTHENPKTKNASDATPLSPEVKAKVHYESNRLKRLGKLP